MSYRMALGVEYDGTDYLGWQVQRHGPSVQATVQQALSRLANEPIEVVCSGRTDAGVHGQCQVVHFDVHNERSDRAFVLGANSALPPDIAVLWAQRVPGDFHARFSARRRRYCYRLLNRPVRPALLARQVAWERRALNMLAMQQAAQSLLGEHDFSAFRTVHCQAPSPIRTLHTLDLRQDGDVLEFHLEANAFLHHMVRNIVGSLMVVGRGEAQPHWVGEVLSSRDRCQAGPTAPAAGLFFVGPRYPLAWQLPDSVSADV
ncbi:MAG: tRNA pseudouridine(38-40) synthase TruA [Xanthomonadales bacterium]|nr:tRNA pseudouridine(38-40) synthase TruA [Xanthomonadales bacterium]